MPRDDRAAGLGSGVRRPASSPQADAHSRNVLGTGYRRPSRLQERPISTDVHAVVRTQLGNSRQRYTNGRQDLVSLLVDLARPVTIPELIHAGATQSQSSLYRNLATLEQCEVVRRMASVDDVARYELAENLTEHHHHLLCGTCGRVDDVVLPPHIEDALTLAGNAAKQQQGYVIDTHHLEFVGTCRTCQ